MSAFQVLTPTGDLAPGISHYGVTIGLPHSNGLTMTFPWWFLAIVGIGGYYAIRKISGGFE